MIVSIATMWIFRVGMANVFVRVLHMDILGIWYAMFIDWIFRVVIFLWKYTADARNGTGSGGTKDGSPFH
jgi:Na+-driven multidrug efflux pump